MKISIIGAGIAGLTTAIALKRIGINSEVFEASPAIKPIGAGLAIAANAIKGFEKLGIAEKVINKGRLLPSFTIMDSRKKIISKTDSIALAAKYGTDNFLIHRAALHRVLLDELADTKIHTDKRAVGLKRHDEVISIEFADGSIHQTNALVVADGINSVLRKFLAPQATTRYSGYTCWRGVVNTPEAALTEATETWDPAGRFGIAPLANGDVYWFACINGKANDPLLRSQTLEDLSCRFQHFHEPVVELINQTAANALIQNDIYDLRGVNNYAYGNIVLIGDAAHATTPNMGQGACQAVEDAVVLGDALSRHADIKSAFISFEKRRLKRTHYIINQSARLGKIAQISNPFLSGIRNALLRRIPDFVAQRQYKKIYEVDF